MNTASMAGSGDTVYSRAPGPADQTSGEQHLDLPFRQGVTGREGAAPGCIPDLNLAVPADLLVQIPQPRNVARSSRSTPCLGSGFQPEGLVILLEA